jgi:hypothetical protein
MTTGGAAVQSEGVTELAQAIVAGRFSAKHWAIHMEALAHAYLEQATEIERLTAQLTLTTAALSPLDEVVHLLGIEDTDDDPAETICTLMNGWKKRGDDAEARASAALAALERYGRHDHICVCYQNFVRADACTCGLHKELAAAKGETE